MAIVTKLYDLIDLAKEKSSERRRDLLREVTDLFFEEPPEQESSVFDKFDDVLMQLAEQTAHDARAALSERFSDAPVAPRGLLLKLAQDTIEVAAPILTKSTALTEEDLVSLAETSAQTHLAALSQRKTVPEAVSDTIVRRGDDDTVATLIRNDGAQISREAYEDVTLRAETSETLAAPLIHRGDTPTDLLGDLMTSVGNQLREAILTRFETIDPDILDEALAASRERLSARLKENEDIQEAEQCIRSLALRKQLNGATLARMLREGERVRFCVGFAELTGVDYTAAQKAIEQDSIDPLALICKHAGIEKALFVSLAILRKTFNQNALSDAKQLGEIYEAIDPLDAARAIRFWHMRKNVAA